jgi:hypothetical protein
VCRKEDKIIALQEEAERVGGDEGKEMEDWSKEQRWFME